MGKRRVMFASAALVVGAIGAGGVATAQGNSNTRFFVRLQGAQEVPPADPDGRATARLKIDTESGEVCWDLHWNRIGTPTMAHIHNAARGVNGPIVVLFFDPNKPVDNPDRVEITNHAEGCSMALTTDPLATARDIAAHPANYYVNIHNARFGGGAVRGQIE
jgi:hypothetical protein